MNYLYVINHLLTNHLNWDKIIHIFKSEDKLLINNYYPISILPFFSKILERLMYNCLLNYLNLSKILVQNRFGFRQGHSTYMALLKLVNVRAEELDKGNCSIGTLTKKLIRLKKRSS